MEENPKNQSHSMNILEQQLSGVSVDNQYLSFIIGGEEYAVEVLLVQEIIRYSDPTRVPNSPEIVKGVINFRGKIIPVIDMRKKFNLEAMEYNSFNVIIVLTVKNKTMGIIVDSVSDVVSFSEADIQDMEDETMEEIKMQQIRGLGQLSDGRLIQIVDPEKMLSLEEIAAMQDMKKKVKGEEVKSHSLGESTLDNYTEGTG